MLISHPTTTADDPVKVITGIVPKLQAVAVLAVAVPATGAGLTVTVTAGADVTVAHGLLVILTK